MKFEHEQTNQPQMCVGHGLSTFQALIYLLSKSVLVAHFRLPQNQSTLPTLTELCDV